MTSTRKPKAADELEALLAQHRRHFYRHFALALALAAGLIAISLLLGTLGYHFLARLAWVDALLNASMILSGMGPVDTLPTSGAKVFASIYAIFSGVVLITASGLLIAPIFHRVLHRFHLEKQDVE